MTLKSIPVLLILMASMLLLGACKEENQTSDLFTAALHGHLGLLRRCPQKQERDKCEPKDHTKTQAQRDKHGAPAP